jgi:hypothetical protein
MPTGTIQAEGRPMSLRLDTRQLGHFLPGHQFVPDALGEGVTLEDHALDPRIAEAAYEAWGWRPESADKATKKK